MTEKEEAGEEKYDFLASTDEDEAKKDLNSNSIFMENIQRVDSNTDANCMPSYNTDALVEGLDYEAFAHNLFAHARKHSEQPESINDTYVVE